MCAVLSSPQSHHTTTAENTNEFWLWMSFDYQKERLVWPLKSIGGLSCTLVFSISLEQLKKQQMENLCRILALHMLEDFPNNF